MVAGSDSRSCHKSAMYCIGVILGLYRDNTPIMENQMEKKMENEMEAGIIMCIMFRTQDVKNPTCQGVLYTSAYKTECKSQYIVHGNGTLDEQTRA